MQNITDRFEVPTGFKPNNNMNENLLKCKKRIEQSSQSRRALRQDPPVPSRSVIRRNERERNRVRMVNNGFATLRQHVPKGTKNKKMSKVETLKSAVEYIKQLQSLLIQDGTSGVSGTSGGFCTANIKAELQNYEDEYLFENKDSIESENLYSNEVQVAMESNARGQRDGHNTYQTENSGDIQSPGYSLTSSPAPSWASENNCSPYSNENSPTEEDDILTFATWFS